MKRAVASESEEAGTKRHKSAELAGDAKPAATSSSSKVVDHGDSKPQSHPKKVQELPWFGTVNTDGKPQQYVSRMMGEMKRIFCVPQGDMVFDPPKKPDLSLWEFVYKTEGVDKDSTLRKQLEQHKLAGVRCELSLPDNFPMGPPMIRVVHPKLTGGFVFSSGAICFEALTPKGWVTTMSLPSLTIALIAFFNDNRNPVSIGSIGDGKTIKEYTYEAARKEVDYIIKAHKGGDSWGQKIQDMKS